MRKILFLFIFIFIISITSVFGMQVSFFEEFPSEENFAKLEFVDEPTKLYVAARNISEFLYWNNYVSGRYEQVEEMIYWPILDEEDGYWISPWTKQDALIELFDEIENHDKPISVMLDLEFPKRRSLLLSEVPKMDQNRQMISDFIEKSGEHNISVYLIEMSHINPRVLESLGMTYSGEEYDVEKIQMYYTSFRRPFLPNVIVNELFRSEAHEAASRNNILGMGLIAPGIYGDEPTYSQETLGMELKIAREEGISEVIVFRLGGVYSGTTLQ